MKDKSVATVPCFNFDPIDDLPKPDRTEEVSRTREAFSKSGYVPPELKGGKAARAQRIPQSKKKSTSETPTWRRPRGRPAGDRQYRISMKTTEDHLSFMYAIADGSELVGAFEHALEALARDVIADKIYNGRPVPADVMKLAISLAEKSER